MPNYNDDNQKDLVLSINEYSYVMDETKGHVICWVGPSKTSLSQSDKLVNFNPRTKRFEPCSYNNAINLFKCAPEGWYIILKNPAKDNMHPKVGTSNNLPEDIYVGKKINIKGPTTFALYPGQMAKVIKGHTLRSNQYLLARVYEAESANSSRGEIRDAEGKLIETNETYVNGQILVIKGTEVSFYIPPTGIEVIPTDGNENEYVRDAITLERLEYCILKDEDGNKRYVHGPEVVFPKPTESFVISPKKGYIFRAIELSKISGIYVKVIAEYDDEDKNGAKVHHPVGEELFITGDDQMIYYPRPEHAIISYDNKLMHHAIAIPEGEGRYIMNRLTGEITTVKGPDMYLPDPRTEVVVKRKLTDKQCALWYPGNKDALAYNQSLNEKFVEKQTKNFSLDELTSYMTSSSDKATLANLEANANISRGTSYTKPRTITLDNKYDGVVSIDVWNGYAINVISKDGTREVICGPKTVMLDYDQTLGELHFSTNRPKNTNKTICASYLRHENNKVGDLISVETKDFVRCDIEVSYCVDFDPAYIDKWFSVDNYVKYLCDRERSLMKREAKKYTIEEFYQNYIDIIRNVAIGYTEETNVDAPSRRGRFFSENGMYVHDCEVLRIEVESEIEDMLIDHQREMVRKSLQLSDAAKRIVVAEELAKSEAKEQALRSEQLVNKMILQREEAIKKMEIQAEVNRLKEAEDRAVEEAKKDLQNVINEIANAERERKEKDNQTIIDFEAKKNELEKIKQEAYAATVAKIMESVSPDLVASLTAKANSELLDTMAHAFAPYAIAAGNESIADTANKLLRGTSLENVLDMLKKD